MQSSEALSTYQPHNETTPAGMSLLDYKLPEDLIAQTPAKTRDASRLLHLSRADGSHQHLNFPDLIPILRAGDLLILNDTKVFPARLRGSRKNTGGKVEVLLLDPLGEGRWSALIRCGGKLKEGEQLSLCDSRLTPRILSRASGGMFSIVFEEFDAEAKIDRYGEIPLPPYIDGSAQSRDFHIERYQTVFAQHRGAVAAPTAGLHFTDEILAALAQKGVEIRSLTLHVGLGTFQPIRDLNLDNHEMHSERYSIPPETRRAIDSAATERRRIIACGTTSARTLESYACTGSAEGETRLFIRPPYEFKLVNGLITNFHLPQTTLLLLVAALIGEERLIAAYQEAISMRYRFYSYGDAMVIL